MSANLDTCHICGCPIDDHASCATECGCPVAWRSRTEGAP